jgi:hypothetical protein
MSADARVLRREGLQIPVWRPVRIIEDFVWQEGEGGVVETGREDDDVGINRDLLAGATGGDTLGAWVEAQAILGEREDVTEPLGVTRADQVEHVGVNHRRSLEDTFVGRDEIREVTLEEAAEQEFRDEAEESLLAQNVK